MILSKDCKLLEVFMPKTKINTEQKQDILNMIQTGITLQEAGDKYNLTRERVRQLAEKAGLDRSQFGVTYRREKEVQDQIQKRLKRYGREVWRLDSLERIQHEIFRRKRQNNRVVRTKDWSIEYNDVVWPTHCPVLGIEIDYYSEGRTENSPSFDRTNPSLGYVKGNVQIISYRANRIKNDGNAQEHLLIYQYLKNHE
jgi:hypothetical protein